MTSIVQDHNDAPYVWLPDVVQSFATLVPRNEVPCTLRLVNKETAAMFKASGQTVVHLSEPVPECEFARHFQDPATMRPLTWRQRRQLLCLTARSGNISNLAALLELPGSPPLWHDVLMAAAEIGLLEMCKWIRERGCPWGVSTLEAAARGGHRHVCEWLLASGCPWGPSAPGAAAAGGHVGLMDWLLQQRPKGVEAGELLTGAAEGCDLATLQRLLGMPKVLAGEGQMDPSDKGEILDAAVASRTADWAAKAEWLLGREYVWGSAKGLVSCPDWRQRLDWMRQRGCPPDALIEIVYEAARAGNTDALRAVLDLGVKVSVMGVGGMALAANGAALAGHVDTLQLLYEQCPEVFAPDEVLVIKDMAKAAGRGGHVPVMAWLVDRLGAAAVLVADTLEQAASTGSTQLVVWLRERGCPWDKHAFASAVASGCEETFTWLHEQGCPLDDEGWGYHAATGLGDVNTLGCLLRLGYPLRAEDDVFEYGVEEACDMGDPAPIRPALQWLLEHGCQPNWGALLKKPCLTRKPTILAAVKAVMPEGLEDAPKGKQRKQQRGKAGKD